MLCDKCPGKESQAACSECSARASVERTRIVYILRGPSGAGKTTFQKRELPAAFVCSADLFFRTGDDYQFDPRKLPEAHASCMASFLLAMKNGESSIVVDNTHTRKWEWVNYKLAAQIAGYEVQVIEFTPKTIRQLRTVAARNAHHVPHSIIADMAINFQHYDDADEVSID